jgi:hypothetical protein
MTACAALAGLSDSLLAAANGEQFFIFIKIPTTTTATSSVRRLHYTFCVPQVMFPPLPKRRSKLWRRLAALLPKKSFV